MRWGKEYTRSGQEILHVYFDASMSGSWDRLFTVICGSCAGVGGTVSAYSPPMRLTLTVNISNSRAPMKSLSGLSATYTADEPSKCG